MKWLVTICLLLAAVPLSAQDNKPPAYKVDLKISDTADQRKESARVYSQILEESSRGDFRVGKKVSVGSNYVDVGMNVAMLVRRPADNTIVAEIDLEISSLDGANIQQVRTKSHSRVTAGRPTIVASFQDPVLQRRMDVELTVTRVP